jgi:hypothetical protein
MKREQNRNLLDQIQMGTLSNRKSEKEKYLDKSHFHGSPTGD